MVDFAKLKANSGKSSLEKLTQELNKINSDEKAFKDDDRFWKPTVDQAKNGYAVIRFLPAPDGEDVPFVRVFDHGFQGPGGWYIENSLTTIGKKDPVSELNSKLWNSTTDDKSPQRTQVRKQKRRLHFISNVYIVNDSSVPANNGKVFLFKYGKKIFDKLNEAMNPQFADEEALNPFDLWAGANFKLKIRDVEGYRSYDKSEFDKVKPLSTNDEELEAIWRKSYSLFEFVDPNSKEHFKSYDQLAAHLNEVLDDSTKSPNPASEEKEAPGPKTKTRAAPKLKEAEQEEEDPTFEPDDDESLAFFKKLAQ